MRRWMLTMLCAVSVCGLGAVSAAADPALPSDDPFYVYSSPLGALAPGSVLRTRTVTVAENGHPTAFTATQVLYRTTGELGQPTVTVASIIRPTIPSLNTHIVSYQTAYDALGSECDPSYTLQGGNASYSTAQDEEQVILAYVAAGNTVVVPDYEGESLAWGSGFESGYGTLDGIRAAEHALGLSAAATPVGMIGYSGGSIATDFAAELAPQYAHELDIVGTAMGGVPVDFFHNLGYINGSHDWSGVIPAVIVGLSRGFGENFTPYLSAYGRQVTTEVKDQCINNFLGAYPGLTIQKLLGPRHQNVLSITPFVDIVNRLIMSRTGTPVGPLLIGVGNADGTGDGVMLAADDEALAHTFCTRGVSVTFTQYSGDTHANAAVPFESDAARFLTTRLSGGAVSNGCPSIGAGNSLAPERAQPTSGTKAPIRLRIRSIHINRHRRGLVVRLATNRGTLRGVVVTLRRGMTLIARVGLRAVGTRGAAAVLREHGRVPRRGRYTIRVARAGRTLIVRRLRLGQ